MSMAEQSLHHREVDAGLGQGGAEGVPQRVRVPGGDPGDLAVIAEDAAQPGLRQRLPAVGPLATMNMRVLAVSGRSASR